MTQVTLKTPEALADAMVAEPDSITAVDMILEHIDEWFTRGQFGQCRKLLRLLMDEHKDFCRETVDLPLSTAVYASWATEEEVPEVSEYIEFLRRVWLESGLPEDRVGRLLSGLGPRKE
ncbi:MAG: hypothetical protein KDB07_03915 [Planctomycetes bacterium]|nr:hypothetical protein [Planctomycetota bacterium]